MCMTNTCVLTFEACKYFLLIKEPQHADRNRRDGSEADIQQLKGGLEKTTFEDREPKSEKAQPQSLDKDGTIVVGHFGESHYISLRPKDWYGKYSFDKSEHALFTFFLTLSHTILGPY